MALLNKIYSILLMSAATTWLTSCYTEFDPDIESTPVLCMNSTITPGEPITLYLTRTWTWTEGDEDKIDINVRDAEVRLTVNGKYRETLKHTIIRNPYYPSGPYPEERECYMSEYRPESGDIIRLEAASVRYGDASAEATVPYPVPIDRIEPQVISCQINGDASGFPAVAEGCQFNLKCNLYAYFTDPSASTDFYDLTIGYSSSYQNNEEAYAYIYYLPYINFSGEPLFKEHVSVIESIIADTLYGYTVFSDRQINGLTYPLLIDFNELSFTYRNPQNLPGPKEYGIEVTLRHIDPTYYKHVISVWEGNDGIVGVLGGAGLANAVFPYSNVSTGAGVVAAYAEASLTIPMVDIIAIAEKGNFK
ncbi:MAG: DUF4249 domain-containing protein [Muribaculaceae bacterium]|nr:DUF4249 domain-containing protein [Muribaculaceae bacterium]